MTSPFRLLIIADVTGETRRHIGDEAMLEANLYGFRRHIPHVAITLVSRDPAWIAARYAVDAVAPLGFPDALSGRAQRAAMLEQILTDAKNGKQTIALVAAVAAADALIVSGGGNLSASWPEQIYERVALIALAQIFDKPVIVLGQTLGPRLREDERQLLAQALCSARFVGLRELPSAALALALGVPADRLWYQIDDAYLPDVSVHKATTSTRAANTTIAITLDPQIRASRLLPFESLAEQLRQLALTTGTSLLLIPHAFGDESANAPSDLTEARILAERIGLAQTAIAVGIDADAARQLTGNSALVISSRYHPIVFGLSAGVPALGIYGDEYCRIKLQGALAHAGLDRWALSYTDITNGGLLENALALWRRRDELSHILDSHHAAWSEEYRERWAAILRALNSAEPLLPAGKARLLGRPIEVTAPALLVALQARQRAWEGEVAHFESLALRCEDAEQRALNLERELGPRQTLHRYATALFARLRSRNNR